MPDWQAVESVLVGAPFGHELIHEGDEAGVVGRFEKVRQFVDDEILFEALGGLFGEVGVEANGAGVVVATAPLGFHTLDKDPLHLHAEAWFPLRDQGYCRLLELLAITEHHGFALDKLEQEDIEDSPASFFIDDVSFVDLRRTAAHELFELDYPEEFQIWEKSSCDGLIFDTERFLDSPVFSTAEFQIGEDSILVVEPL